MIDPDTGIVLDDASGDGWDDDDDEEEEEPSVEEMKEAIMTFEGTFTEPLDETDPAVQAFLEEFDIASKTEEIAQVLKDNPETLEKTFTLLNSDVQYEDFWKRYFYRCIEEERVITQYQVFREWKNAEDEKEKNLRLANTPVRAGLTTVTNFLGGAVKALVDDGDDDPVAPSPFFNASGQQAPTGEGNTALGFFGSSGRPPFVMNTAVSEDEDDDNNDSNDEEEEEELGWGSDDEEDFDDDDDDGDGAVGQIEFRDAQKEKLEDDLAQAVDERDQLQKTVQMQTEEIKALKDAASDASGSKQVESLKMQIFEKDSEIAALKASLADTQEDEKAEAARKDAEKSAFDRREMEKLVDEVSSKDAEIQKLKLDLQAARDQLESSISDNQNTSQEQSAELTSLRSDFDSARAESAVNKASLEQALSEKSKLEVELQSQVSNMAGLRSELENARSESETNKASLEQALSKNASMEVELQSQASKINGLQSELENAQARSEATSDHTALEQAHAEKSSLELELHSMKELVSSLQSDNESLQQNSSQASLAEQKAAEAESRAEELQEELMALKDTLEVANQHTSQMEQELKTVKQSLADKELELSKEKASPAPSSPDSISTGIKVSEEEPTVTKLDVDGDDDGDDDGWGDDW